MTPVGEAIAVVSALVGRKCSDAEFAKVVVDHRLQILAVAPGAPSIVSYSWVDGRRIVTPQPTLSAHYITLLQEEIRQLSIPGGQIITDRPAWTFSDTEYRTWDEILEFRAANHRVLRPWEIDEGEWMGQSETYFFAQPIGVTTDTVLVVPRHTIAEVVRLLNSQYAKVAPLGQETNQVPKEEVTLVGPSADPGVPVKTMHTWDQHGLRRLLEESRMPGATQSALAAKHDVSRQFIGKQLTKAKQLFERQKASPFDSLNTRGKK